MLIRSLQRRCTSLYASQGRPNSWLHAELMPQKTKPILTTGCTWTSRCRSEPWWCGWLSWSAPVGCLQGQPHPKMGTKARQWPLVRSCHECPPGTAGGVLGAGRSPVTLQRPEPAHKTWRRNHPGWGWLAASPVGKGQFVKCTGSQNLYFLPLPYALVVQVIRKTIFPNSSRQAQKHLIGVNYSTWSP